MSTTAVTTTATATTTTVAALTVPHRTRARYNHVLDDPSMGHTRSCHGLRIAAHDAGLLYAHPTHESAALFARVAQRLRTEGAASEPSRVMSEELWLPAYAHLRAPTPG